MAELMLVNPHKRRKAKRRTTSKRRSPRRAISSVTRKTVTRRYRRNPIRKSGIMDTAKTGAIGAIGALGVDIVMSKLPLPEQFTMGTMAPITKGLVGIGLGMAVAKFGKNKKLGTDIANGAVTVSLYNTMKTMVDPQLGLSGYDDGLLGWDDGLLGFEDFAESANSGMGYAGVEPVSPWGDEDEF